MAVDLSRLNMELSGCRGLARTSQRDGSLRQPCFDGSSEAAALGNHDGEHPVSSSPSGTDLQQVATGRSTVSSNLADGPKFVPWRAGGTSQHAAASCTAPQPYAARLATPERRACNRIQATKAPPSPNDPELCTNLRKSALLRSMLSRSEEPVRQSATSPRQSRMQLSAATLGRAASVDSDTMSMSQRSMSMSISYDIDGCDQDDEVQS